MNKDEQWERIVKLLWLLKHNNKERLTLSDLKEYWKQTNEVGVDKSWKYH